MQIYGTRSRSEVYLVMFTEITSYSVCTLEKIIQANSLYVFVKTIVQNVTDNFRFRIININKHAAHNVEYVTIPLQVVPLLS